MRRLFRLTSGRRAILVRALLALAFTPSLASADWPTFGRALAVAPGDQIGAAIAPDGAGGAIVAWHDRRIFPFNLDAQHVLATGEVDPTWPANGRALLTDALIQTIVPQGVEFPVIVSDGGGGAIVSWPDARSTVTGLDIYAHHVLASGVVDPAWPVNGTTVCSAIREQGNPSIISDGAGGAFIAWDDNRPGTTLNDRDIFAQHVLASGLVDPAWPANGTAVVTAPKAQISPVIVGDGAGGIIVTWNDLRSGNPGIDMFAQHVLGSGTVDPAWPVDGLALSAAPGSQVGQSVVSDGGNGAIVAWTDTRDGTNEIFAQRVLSSGTIAAGWPTNGLAISIGGTDEVSPTLASDGAGGAIVAWGGGNSGHHNMLAQHLLGSGALDPAWPVGGVHLGFANSEQQNQGIASDGAGGAIVAWQQGNDVTAFDIFAQHVLASGALDSAYPASGRAVCALLGLQHEPSIVAAGAGGAIVTWEDTRNNTNDIFALQVLEAGTTGVPDTSPLRITFARPHPNPATGLATLRFTLPRAARVRLAIYDLVGRRVRDLVSGTTPAGAHAIPWDLRDNAGARVGAGLYFARLESEGRTFTEKLTALQ